MTPQARLKISTILFKCDWHARSGLAGMPVSCHGARSPESVSCGGEPANDPLRSIIISSALDGA
jgi:hypothetical protein